MKTLQELIKLNGGLENFRFKIRLTLFEVTDFGIAVSDGKTKLLKCKIIDDRFEESLSHTCLVMPVENKYKSSATYFTTEDLLELFNAGKIKIL